MKKSFFVSMVLMIVMLIFWPPGDHVKASTIDQVNFVVDHQPIAPVCAVMAPVQEKGGVYLMQCYNQIDVKAVLTESHGELKVNEYAMISPPKSASLNKVYTKHLRKVSHPPLLSKRCIQKNKVWPEYGMIRIRSMQEPTEDLV